MSRRMQAALAVFAIAVIVYAPSLGGQFLLDDSFVARAVDLGSLGNYFTTHWWVGHYAGSELFRPITKLSYALVYAGLGEPFAQHLVNVLAHAACSLLVFGMLSTLRCGLGAAFAGGMVFAVHAIHSEAVCTLTGRAELFAFGFGAAATLLVCRGGIWRLGAAAALFFCAFGSKEGAVFWLVFCPLFASVVRRGFDWRSLVAIPGFAAWFWLRSSMIAGLETIPATTVAANPLVAVPTATRLLSAFEIQGFALGRTLFPIHLSCDYGPRVFAPVTSPLDFRFLIAVAVVLPAIVLAVLGARRRPLLLLAFTAFFGFAFVTSNLPFAIGTIFAERLYYAPSLGLSIAVAWLAARSIAADRLPGLVVGVVLWCGHNTAYSFRRSLMWHDDSTIALHDARVKPDSANLRRLASAALVKRGDLPGARGELEAAADLDPSFAATWLNLGAIRERLNDVAGAEAAYRSGLAKADASWSRERASLEGNLGALLIRTGHAADGIAHLRASVALEPTSVRHRAILMSELRKLKPVPDAEIAELLDAGERLVPGHFRWAWHRGLLAARRRRHADAVREFSAVLAREPGFHAARLELARSLKAVGRSAAARREIERLLADPTLPASIRREAEEL